MRFHAPYYFRSQLQIPAWGISASCIRSIASTPAPSNARSCMPTSMPPAAPRGPMRRSVPTRDSRRQCRAPPTPPAEPIRRGRSQYQGRVEPRGGPYSSPYYSRVSPQLSSSLEESLSGCRRRWRIALSPSRSLFLDLALVRPLVRLAAAPLRAINAFSLPRIEPSTNGSVPTKSQKCESPLVIPCKFSAVTCSKLHSDTHSAARCALPIARGNKGLHSPLIDLYGA
jgi:hypothetical protein